MRRWSRWLRGTMVSGGLLLLGAAPLRAEEQRPWWCPSTYAWGWTKEILEPSRTRPNIVYSFKFYFGTGRANFQVYPGELVTYSFGDLKDGDRASYLGAWITARCWETYQLLPPFEGVQQIWWVVAQGNGGTLVLNFAEPAEDNACFGEAARVWPGQEPAADSVSRRRAPRDVLRLSARLTPFRRPAANLLTCTTESNTPVNSDPPPGGGGGGGGQPKNYMCLFYDHYDENGEYLYTETAYCWEAVE